MVFHRRLYDICHGRNVLAIHDQDDETPSTDDPRGKSLVMPAIVEEAEPTEDQAITPPPAAARVPAAPKPRRIISAKRGGFRQWRWFAAAAGLGLAACLILALMPRFGSPARLTALAGVSWERDAMPVGSKLDRGQIVQLRSGTAELTFASGASVILQGPVAFHVADRNAGALDYGKLVAHVPGAAHGFTVTSSNLQIADLGTEFGLSVSRAGVARVEVFKGKLEITRPDQTVGRQPPIQLTSNQTVSCQVSEGEIEPAAPNSEAFVREMAETRLPIALHNTGMGLRVGDRDPNWKLLSPGESVPQARSAFVASPLIGRYLANDPDHSQWISSVADFSRVATGKYIFRSTFDLTGFDPASVEIHVKCIADDKIHEVRVNGMRAALPRDATSWTFTEFHAFTLTGHFRSGINTVEFEVPNGGETPTAMGLRVEWEGSGAPIVQR